MHRTDQKYRLLYSIFQKILNVCTMHCQWNNLYNFISRYTVDCGINKDSNPREKTAAFLRKSIKHLNKLCSRTLYNGLENIVNNKTPIKLKVISQISFNSRAGGIFWIFKKGVTRFSIFIFIMNTISVHTYEYRAYTYTKILRI